MKSSDDRTYDLSALRKASAGNEAFMQKMIKLFITQTEEGLTKVRHSYEQNDLDQVRSIMHQLKPSINMMGVNAIKEDLVRLIEDAGEQKNLDQISDRISTIENELLSAIEQLKKNEVNEE